MRWIVFLLIIGMSVLSAEEISVEFRAGYFNPSSDRMCKIYHDGGFETELELAYTFGECWQGWANAGFFSREGRSSGFHDKTHVTLVPVSAGVRYLFCLSENIHLYLGLGGSYGFLHVRDRSCFVDQHMRKGSFGIVAKSGLYFDIIENFFLDLYCDYYYQKVHSVNVGGLRTGLGLGFAF